MNLKGFVLVCGPKASGRGNLYVRISCIESFGVDKQFQDVTAIKMQSGEIYFHNCQWEEFRDLIANGGKI